MDEVSTGDGSTPEASTPEASSKGPAKGRFRSGVLRVVALAYVGVTIMAATFADRLIFVPPPSSYDRDADGLVLLAGEDTEGPSGGDTVAAMYLPVHEAPYTVLYAHGNAEDLGDLRPFLEAYRALGVSVMAFDYPGYGLSTGTPSEDGAYRAAEAAYRYLVSDYNVSPDRLILHGRSLGGGVLVDLAARLPIAGLVMESTFVSAYRVMTRYTLLPVDQFRSLKKLNDVQVPALIIHGTADDVIAPWHGRRLADAIPEGRRQELWVDGAGHNDLVAIAGEGYWSALRDFVGSVGDTLRPR